MIEVTQNKTNVANFINGLHVGNNEKITVLIFADSEYLEHYEKPIDKMIGVEDERTPEKTKEKINKLGKINLIKNPKEGGN